jgi:AbiU2
MPYEPTPKDFRRIRAHIRKRRKIYENNYRDLRNKFFAHKDVSERAEIDALFGKGTVRELQQLFAFLGSLHEALWQLLFNGLKPILRPLRYSVRRMMNLPSPTMGPKAVQEHITHETERFLMSVSSVARRPS